MLTTGNTTDGQKFLVLFQEEQADNSKFETIMNWPGLLQGQVSDFVAQRVFAQTPVLL